MAIHPSSACNGTGSGHWCGDRRRISPRLLVSEGVGATPDRLMWCVVVGAWALGAVVLVLLLGVAIWDLLARPPSPASQIMLG